MWILEGRMSYPAEKRETVALFTNISINTLFGTFI